jgi:hypothetical protein
MAARARPARRRWVRWLVLLLAVVVAVVAYAQLTGGDEASWEALRAYPFGAGKCAVALSPDRVTERTVCVAGGETSCYDGRRILAMTRNDCRAARAALTEEGLLPSS